MEAGAALLISAEALGAPVTPPKGQPAAPPTPEVPPAVAEAEVEPELPEAKRRGRLVKREG